MDRRVYPTHRPRSHAPNSYGKRVAVGNTSGTVPPAWRAAQSAPHLNNGDASRRQESHQVVGSKIILSQLPPDSVSERDIEDLMTSQIGPVYDCYLVYNSQGRSKGVAIVHFQRRGDALEARRMFDGKIIDGRRPLKIELIVDPPPGALIKKKEKTLAERLSAPVNSDNSTAQEPVVSPPRQINPRRLTARVRARSHRQTIKRGPRRPNKSALELDQEMDTYMAARKPIRSAASS